MGTVNFELVPPFLHVSSVIEVGDSFFDLVAQLLSSVLQALAM